MGLRQFGLLAATVFGHWGVRSTSDIGDIVYHLIDAGDLEKTPSDSRSDFDNVFDFETALRPRPLLANDDTTDTPGVYDLEPIDPSAKGEQAVNVQIRSQSFRRGPGAVPVVGRGVGNPGRLLGISPGRR